MNFLVRVMILLTAIKADWPVFLFGRCPRVRGTRNFDANRYLGKWYQQSALPQIFQDSSDRCVTADYTPLSVGVIGVFNSGVDNKGVRSGVRGSAALTANTNRGELNVAFFSASPSSTADPNYIVLDTDYTTVAHVWSCTNFGFFHVPALWILSRESNPTVAFVNDQEEAAIDILRGFGYTKSIRRRLIKTKHNCNSDSVF